MTKGKSKIASQHEHVHRKKHGMNQIDTVSPESRLIFARIREWLPSNKRHLPKFDTQSDWGMTMIKNKTQNKSYNFQIQALKIIQDDKNGYMRL